MKGAYVRIAQKKILKIISFIVETAMGKERNARYAEMCVGILAGIELRSTLLIILKDLIA